MNSLKIRILQDSDIPILKTWLNKNHVLKWYNNPDDWLTEVHQRFDKFNFIKHFIVFHENTSIGFCQYYACKDAQEDWYGDIPTEGSYSIDYLIGEEAYLGKGIAKGIITLLEKQIFSLDEAQRIIVSPDASNIASCKTLLASGFTFDKKNKLYYKEN